MSKIQNLKRLYLIGKLKEKAVDNSVLGLSIRSSIDKGDDPEEILQAIANQSKTNFEGVETTIGRSLLQEILKYCVTN